MRLRIYNYKYIFLGLTLIGLLRLGDAVGENAEEALDRPVELNLVQALEMAHAFSAELRATQIHLQAAQKEHDAAGAWKNPLLMFKGEGVGVK